MLRVRLVLPDAQVLLQVSQSVHCESVQSQVSPSLQFSSWNNSLSSGQTPPYCAAVRTARLRLWNPWPHGWLQADHCSQSDTVQSIGANVGLGVGLSVGLVVGLGVGLGVGHGCSSQRVVSDVEPHAAPAWVVFCVIVRVRLVKPSPQETEQLDHAVQFVTPHSAGHGLDSHTCVSNKLPDSGHTPPY